MLGGYDVSRLGSDILVASVTNTNKQNYLMVSLESISSTNTFQGAVQTLLMDPVNINIDSAVSQLWLPLDVCNNFASAFGLQYDSSRGLYLVNETTHDRLVSNNPVITISLGLVGGGGNRINIDMPYNAFDLNATIPIYNESKRYFPIRQAANSSQYTLGRTFLQEAYIVVDWESSNFTVGAAIPQSSTTDVKGILPASDGNTTVSGSGSQGGQPTSPSKGGSSGISGGAIAGIVIGVLAILAIAIGVFFFMRRRKQRQASANHGDYTAAPVEEDAHHARGVQEHYPPEKSGEKMEYPPPAHPVEPIYEVEADVPAELNAGNVSRGASANHTSRNTGAAGAAGASDGHDRELMSEPVMELPGSAVGSELDVSRIQRQATHRATGSGGVSSPLATSPLASPHSETTPSAA